MLEELRCKKCNKKLGEKLSGKIEIVCPRCGYFNLFKAWDLTKPEKSAYTLDRIKPAP